MKINKFEIAFDIIVLFVFWFCFGANLTELLNGNYINQDFTAHLLIVICEGLVSLGSIFVVCFDFKKLLKYIKWLENNNDDDNENGVKE